MRRRLDLIRDLFFILTIISSPLASAETYDSWSDVEGVKSEHELIALECEMLRAAMAKTLKAMGPELIEHYPAASVPGPEKVLTFAEAQEILGISGEESLTAEQERTLGAMMQAEGFELVALTQVPWAQRPFYHMKQVVEGRELTRSFELIYRGRGDHHRRDSRASPRSVDGSDGRKGVDWQRDGILLGELQAWSSASWRLWNGPSAGADALLGTSGHQGGDIHPPRTRPLDSMIPAQYS